MCSCGGGKEQEEEEHEGTTIAHSVKLDKII